MEGGFGGCGKGVVERRVAVRVVGGRGSEAKVWLVLR